MGVGCEKLSTSGMRLEWDLSVSCTLQEELETTAETRSILQGHLPDVRFNLFVDSVSELRKLDHSDDGSQTFYHVGQIVNQDVPTTFLRHGLQICKSHHGHECERPKSIIKSRTIPEETPDLRFLRVIDVHQKCLVPLPAESSYIALSYTWSPEPYLSLLKETRHDLELSGGIKINDLPPTIADAMVVVARLGERYLWADRLCIVQDDPRDKRVQIHQMDTIYRYATLTIVAAGSKDTERDVGLPGIQSGSRTINQASVTIRGLTFVETHSWLDDAIEQSRWYSRAWTFQEHLLSRRHLVFTPTRAAFFCNKDTFTEDYVRRAGSLEHHPANDYVTPESSDDVKASGIATSVLAYEIMVRWYTQRNLTVESDILKGVSGLLQTVTRETEHRFLCGMPMTNLIDHSLLWLPRGSSVRRGPNAFGLPFPSWSWAGWVGAATYIVSGESLDARAEVSFDEEPLVKDYSILVATSSDMYHERRREDLEDDVLLNLEWCKLSFIAASAKVAVSKTLWGHFTDAEASDLDNVSRCNQVFVDGKFAGMLLTHNNMGVEDLQALECNARIPTETEMGEVELVALSTTYRPWPVYFPIGDYGSDNANYYYTNADGNEKDHLPFDTAQWNDEDPELVNVMAIEWDGDMAFRRGVGQVHVDAWKMLNAVEKKVVLG